MPYTRGGANKRKPFTWHYDPDLKRISTTSQAGIVHTYSVGETQAILQHLHAHFGEAFLPLANNVAKLGAGTERPGLCSTTDDHDVFKAIVRVARNADKTPYEVDALFWLVGSGNFYLDEPRIGGHRDDFIDYAR